jgi:hypothetical protein
MERCAKMMALAALVLAVAAGCGGDDDGDDAGDGDGDDSIRLAQRASEVRELAFLEDVEVVRMTRAEFRAQADANAGEIDDVALRELAETYGRLGFFAMDLDLRPILAGASSDYVGATYSARNKVITLIEDNPGDAPAATQVHEFVHALQDQHFDLIEFDGSTSDEFLARRAVVEGDATLAEARFRAQDEHSGELDGWDWPQLLASWDTWRRDLLAGSPYPVFFVDYPSFVYPFGLRFTAINLLGWSLAVPAPHDWALEDELFTERPPATVQQVIRPELESDPGELIGLDAVPSELEGRLEGINWDTLGEWYIYLLFYPMFADLALELTVAWEGDRVLFLSDVERGGAVATVWASSWIDATAAGKVVTALDDLYGRTPSGVSPEGGTASDGETLWIEQRDRAVVAIKNLDPALAGHIADAAFDPPVARRATRSRPPIARRLRELFP